MPPVNWLFAVAFSVWGLVVGSVLVWEVLRLVGRGVVFVWEVLRWAVRGVGSVFDHKRRKKRRHLLALRAEAQRTVQDSSDRSFWKRRSTQDRRA